MADTPQMDLVRKHIEYFSERNWDAYRSTMAPGGFYEEPALGRRVEGPDAVIKALELWTKAFPDLHGTIRSMVAHDDMVVAEIRWEGTQKGVLQGPFGEIPPSNKRGTLDAVELFRIRGDKIAEARHYFDLLTILTQVGVPLPHLVATPV